MSSNDNMNNDNHHQHENIADDILSHNNPTFFHGFILTFIIYGMTIACHVLLPGRRVVGYVCSDDPRKHDILMYKLNGISTYIMTIVMIIILLHMYLVLQQEGFTWRYLHVLFMTWWSSCYPVSSSASSQQQQQQQQQPIQMHSPLLYIAKCRLGLLMGSQFISLCLAHYFYRRGIQWNQKHAPNLNTNTRQYTIRALSRDQVTRSQAFVRTIRKVSHHHHPQYQSPLQQRRQSRRQMWHDFYAGMGEFNPRTILQFPPSSSSSSSTTTPPTTTSPTSFYSTNTSASTANSATYTSTTNGFSFRNMMRETIDWKLCIVQCQTIMTQLLVLSVMMTAMHHSYNNNNDNNHMHLLHTDDGDNHRNHDYDTSSTLTTTTTASTTLSSSAAAAAAAALCSLVVSVLQLMTVLWTCSALDYMSNERTYLYSQDLCSERIGFKLLWTRLCVVPFLSTMSMWEIMNIMTMTMMNQSTNHDHHDDSTISTASTMTSAAASTSTTLILEQRSIIIWCSFLYFIGWCITRGTLYQKFIFKTRPTQTTWIPPSYPTSLSFLFRWFQPYYHNFDFFQQQCIYTRPKQQQQQASSSSSSSLTTTPQQYDTIANHYNNNNNHMHIHNDVPRQLLKSGFWSMARHFHSFGTILQAMALSIVPMMLLLRTTTMNHHHNTMMMMMVNDMHDMNINNNNSGDTGDTTVTAATATTTTTSTLLWLYPAWIIWFSIHRQIKDDAMCRIRYGNDAWDEYCDLVPYRIIPYVY